MIKIHQKSTNDATDGETLWINKHRKRWLLDLYRKRGNAEQSMVLEDSGGMKYFQDPKESSFSGGMK